MEWSHAESFNINDGKGQSAFLFYKSSPALLP